MLWEVMRMDEEFKDQLRQQLLESLARDMYREFFLLANPEYYLLPHIELIIDALQDIIDGVPKFLIIEMPPRHGKSATITETFPSFYMMKNPDKETMIVAYSEDLYIKFGRKNRDKFKQYAPKVSGLELSKSVSSASEWGVEGHKGVVKSTSITGGATGRGADLLIIDDPVKNMQEAESETVRNRIWEEWQATFSTRLHSGASVIVIMTRWHEDDLAGRLLKQMAKPWEEIKIPAVAESDEDLLGRDMGQPLAPDLGFDEKWADETQKTVGSRVWSALYQQRPTPASGGVFKKSWLRYYVDTPETKTRLGLDDSVLTLPKIWDKQVQSWDASFKGVSTSDYVAGQVWGVRDNKHFMLDRWHERMGFVDTVAAIKQTSTRWPNAHGKYIEEKANGAAIIDSLRDELTGIIPVTPKESKEARAQAITPFFEAGNVYIPHPDWKPEISEYIDELLAFPNGAHDDEVDSTSQALSNIGARRQSVFERFGIEQ